MRILSNFTTETRATACIALQTSEGHNHISTIGMKGMPRFSNEDYDKICAL